MNFSSSFLFFQKADLTSKIYFRFFTFVIPGEAFRSHGIQEYYSKSSPQQAGVKFPIYFTFYVNLLIGIKIISWHSRAHWTQILVYGCWRLTEKQRAPHAFPNFTASRLINLSRNSKEVAGNWVICFKPPNKRSTVCRFQCSSL